MARRVRIQPETQFEIAVTKSNGCVVDKQKRADDRTKEDRYVLGAGPPDLWDSWSKVLGEIKTRIEKTGPVLFLPAFLRVRSDQIDFSRSLDTGRSVKSGAPVLDGQQSQISRSD